MKKNKRFEIRVSADELNSYKAYANKCKMSPSDWARNKLNENRGYTENAPALAKIAADMQTNLNKISAGIDVTVQLDNLQKGVEQLCQFLKK